MAQTDLLSPWQQSVMKSFLQIFFTCSRPQQPVMKSFIIDFSQVFTLNDCQSRNPVYRFFSFYVHVRSHKILFIDFSHLFTLNANSHEILFIDFSFWFTCILISHENFLIDLHPLTIPPPHFQTLGAISHEVFQINRFSFKACTNFFYIKK